MTRAYRNGEFLDGEEGRPLRILAEYLEPLSRLRREGLRDTVVFFGSARAREDGPMASYYRDARELARRLTVWSDSLPVAGRFVVCSGGGPGIMEAANRGAVDAGGRTLGLNIGLPHEQRPNPYVTPELMFEFHYFFMRKLWFAHLARALVVFPGGFGTLDELAEVLTLTQTGKLARPIQIILYGRAYWNQVISFDALLEHGTISAEDLNLFQWADDPETAFRLLATGLPLATPAPIPAVAPSVVPNGSTE